MGRKEKNSQVNVSRKDLGAWYTPPSLCRFLAERALAGMKHSPGQAGLTICDPMVGAGAFLEVARELTGGAAVLYGVDVDPRAVQLARRRLGRDMHLRQGNALVSPLTPADRAWLAAEHRELLAEMVRSRYSRRPATGVQRAVRELLRTLVAERLGPMQCNETDRMQPFCWELEFPEIFFTGDGLLREDAGFDVVLGNPPWNNLRADDREFFARHEPAFRELRTRRERNLRRQTLLRSTALRRVYERYLEGFRRWNELLRGGRFYQHQGGPDEGFVTYRIEHNLYKLALERAWELARPGGRIGLLVPAGFLGDLGATQLRRLYFDGGACLGLWSFHEHAGIFDAAQAFVVVVFEKGVTPRSFSYSAGLEDLSTARAKPRAAGLSVDLLRRIAPITYAVPDLSSAAELTILDKLHRHPPLAEIKPSDPWRARPARDLHTRDDHDLLVASADHKGANRKYLLPALKGADIEAFRLRMPCRHWVEERAYQERGKDFHASRVAWRAIANVHLARRMQAALVPARHALLNSLNYFIPEQPEVVKFYLLGLLNSLVLEWRVRQMAKNNNINQYVIASLPVPRLTDSDERLYAIAALSRRLTTAGKRAEGFSPAGLRAELEARVAMLYELSADELVIVMQRFPRVTKEEKEQVMAAFALLI